MFLPGWPVPLTSFDMNPCQGEMFLFSCSSAPLVFPAVPLSHLILPSFLQGAGDTESGGLFKKLVA